MEREGRVVRLPEGKQFGFVQNPDGQDVFFHRDDFNGHWNDLLKDFRKGIIINVSFDENRAAKGLRATEVRRLDHPNV